MIFFNNCFGKYKIDSIFAPAMNRLYYLKSQGTLAQMVEQWTENPCVPGSIPGGTTKTLDNPMIFMGFLFVKIKVSQ